MLGVGVRSVGGMGAGAPGQEQRGAGGGKPPHVNAADEMDARGQTHYADQQGDTTGA